MNKEWMRILVTLAFLTVFTSFAFAKEAGQKEPAATAGTEAKSQTRYETLTDMFHNPAPWLEMGADLRLRYIYADNIDTLNRHPGPRTLANGTAFDYDESKWIFGRYRTRWWQKLKLNDDIDINSRLLWEFRTWDQPNRKNQSTDFDEILFDQLNITMRNFMDMPMTAVVGRQDIILGKGWLVLDGTPLDGSRSIFFDALRLTYDLKEYDTTLDMIYIDQHAASDAWLKPINDRHRYLTEQDEQGAIFYVTNKSWENTQVEGYFIYKNDNPVNQTPTDFPDPWPMAWSKKAEIFTYGGAISGDIDRNWNYRTEAAIQTGEKSGNDLRAYGGKADLGYSFHDEKDNKLRTAYEYLSGDNPNTSKNEQFDPLWGEWPQWSELYVYTYQRETMIGETTNLHRLAFGHSFKPDPKLQLDTDYHLLWADQNTKQYTPAASDGFRFSDHGKFRGHLITCWLKYKLTEKVKGHLLAEYFIPGNYYHEGTRDDAVFLRANLEYTF